MPPAENSGGQTDGRTRGRTDAAVDLGRTDGRTDGLSDASFPRLLRNDDHDVDDESGAGLEEGRNGGDKQGGEAQTNLCHHCPM